jgi:hypothetical protein
MVVKEVLAQGDVLGAFGEGAHFPTGNPVDQKESHDWRCTLPSRGRSGHFNLSQGLFGQTLGVLTLWMYYVEGQGLSELSRRNSLPAERAAWVTVVVQGIREVAKAKPPAP